MPQAKYLIEVAKNAIEDRKVPFDMLLPYYPNSVREAVERERSGLLLVADHLQRSWEALCARCKSATSTKPLVDEMRQIRIRAFQFNLGLRSQKHLLKVQAQRINTRAALAGLNSEAGTLRISEASGVIDDMKQVSEGLQGQFHQAETRANEFRLFLESVFFIIESRKVRKTFGGVGKIFKRSWEAFLAASTRQIYREQWRIILIVIWRVLQPTVVAAAFTVCISLFVALLEEAGGIEVRYLELWALLVFVLLVLAKIAAERLFEEWHLERYRRTVMETALRVYASEIRARAALVGLATMADAEPIAASAKTG